MPIAHLTDLRVALGHQGGTILEYFPGDDNVIGAASWHVRRGWDHHWIDFDGSGTHGEDLSLCESHGCKIRGSEGRLSFCEVETNRPRWLKQLAEFLCALNEANVRDDALVKSGLIKIA